MTREPLLVVKKLSVALPEGADRALAVDDVSFDVCAGEIVCIVGESGSGKSVTSYAVMRLLARNLRVISGEIRFEGRDVLALPDRGMRDIRGQRVAMIFQEPMTALTPTMRVGRLIEEPLRIHTRMNAKARRERALELMRQVNLPQPAEMYSRYPHQLSGGQRQRVMIAMALALDPALLIADEPTTALDVTTQAQILALIRDLQRRSGMAILFVTHDLAVVSEIANRVVVMQQGRVVEQGRVSDVLEGARHPYTQALLAAMPGLAQRRRVAPNGRGPDVIRVEGISKAYASGGIRRRRNTVLALDEVAITIADGETLAIVGESGSGKSTLARCISGLIAPDRGSIVFNSRGNANATGTVQVIFQDPNRSLDPRWRVEQCMLEGMRNAGLDRLAARARAGELMERIGLSRDALARYPHEFSGGQRQRICIARALSMQPRLLIADEAVSALDVSVQAQVLILLDEMQREFGFAMLFITHDLRVAAQISDRIAVMQRGKIVEQGPALDVLSDPRHEYTRLLFNSAPALRRRADQPPEHQITQQ